MKASCESVRVTALHVALRRFPRRLMQLARVYNTVVRCAGGVVNSLVEQPEASVIRGPVALA